MRFVIPMDLSVNRYIFHENTRMIEKIHNNSTSSEAIPVSHDRYQLLGFIEQRQKIGLLNYNPTLNYEECISLQ